MLTEEHLDLITRSMGDVALIDRLISDHRRMSKAIRTCDPVILDTYGRATCRFCGGWTFQPHIPHADDCIWITLVRNS